MTWSKTPPPVTAPGRARLTVVLIGAGLLAQGCTPDFEDAWVVRDLRILAMKATPPEVLFDAIPSRMPPVRLEALVAHPDDPDPVVAWELWVCSADKTRCDAARVKYLAAAGKGPASGLSWSVVISGAFFGQVMQVDTQTAYAGADLPLRYRNGVPVMVELRVRRGQEQDRAVKRLIYGLRYPAQKLANQNPTLDAVDISQGGGLLHGTVLRDARPLVLHPRASTAEEFIVPTLAYGDLLAGGKPRLPKERIVYLREYLTYRFFITSGALSRPVTGGAPQIFVRERKVDDITSTWMPLPLATPVPLWVVVQDGRGGVDWETLSFRFQ